MAYSRRMERSDTDRVITGVAGGEISPPIEDLQRQAGVVFPQAGPIPEERLQPAIGGAGEHGPAGNLVPCPFPEVLQVNPVRDEAGFLGVQPGHGLPVKGGQRHERIQPFSHALRPRRLHVAAPMDAHRCFRAHPPGVGGFPAHQRVPAGKGVEAVVGMNSAPRNAVEAAGCGGLW